MKTIITWTTVFVILTALAFAGVPQTINYQGYLKNTDGTPVNTATNVRFSLYSSNPARNNPVWRDTRSVTPANGVYSIVLGQTKPITAPFDNPYWLGVQVQSDPEMTPLQPLAASPYAFRAATADSVGSGALADGSVTDAKITGPISDGKLSSNVSLLNSAQTFTGVKTFNPAGGTVPFTVDSSKQGIVPNLNAEMVGGQKLADLDLRYSTPSAPNPTLPQIASLRWDQVRSGDLTVAVGIGTQPAALVFDGTSVWVANMNSRNVMKLNPATGTILGTYPVGASPSVLAFDGTNIWVVNEGSDNIMKLNPATGAILGTYAVGTTPSALAFDGVNIWVANANSANVMKLNPATGAVLGTFAVGFIPAALTFDGSSVWVANKGNDNIMKLNPATGAILGTYPVGYFPQALTFDGSNIWVANFLDNNVQKINPATGAVLGTYTVGSYPGDLLFDGANIWVANLYSNNVMKLNSATGTVLGTYTVGTHPHALAFDGASIWVANFNSNSVIKLANAGIPVGDQTVGTAQLANNAVTTVAIAAGSVTDAKISGTIAAAKLDLSTVVSKAGDTMTGTLDVAGTVKATQFSGDGSGLSNIWKTTGNAGTTPGAHFIGTTDNQALEIRVNNARAIRIEPNATSPNMVAGHLSNMAGGVDVYGATVSGGGGPGTNCYEPSTGQFTHSCANHATNTLSTVGGGSGNTASADSSTISGGNTNTASGVFSTVGGGYSNTASGGFGTISGGYYNTASGAFGTISGGYYNTASAESSTISGGNSNTASGVFSTVGGGYSNTASGSYGTISGGSQNQATASAATVAGGARNIASANNAFVAGGTDNIAAGQWSFAGGLKAKTEAAPGTPHDGAFVFSGSNNFDFRSNTANEFAARATGGVRFVTAIDGAGNPTKTFQIDNNGNVGIGTTSPNRSLHISNPGFAEISMAVADGTVNNRTWNLSANSASPNMDFRILNDAGTAVTKQVLSLKNDGTVNIPNTLDFGATTRQMLNLWGTEYGVGVQSYTTYFRSGSNFTWYKGGVHSNSQGDPGAGGAYLMGLSSSGLSVNGTFVSASDRNAKENFEEIDSRQILEKVAGLPIQRWNYRTDDSKTPHIGPMAQDFHAAFNVGPDDKHIATVDADGIALAAIKALNVKLTAVEAENADLKQRLERLERLLISN